MVEYAEDDFSETSIYYRLGPGMPADNDDLVPPVYFLNRDISREPIDLEYIKKGANLPIVISFGGSGLDPDTGESRYAMQKFLKDSRVSQISVRDQYTCWFHNGIRGVSTDVMSTVDRLKELIADSGSKRVLCTGSSAGAYAAILFGTLLNATGVIALCPQTLLKRGIKCQAHGYLYLLKWADGQGTKQQYADLLDLPESEVPIELVYGTDDFVDVFHAERMQSLNNVHLVPVAGNHGTAILATRNSGLLSRLFSDALNESTGDLIWKVPN